ncbi:hypothetical protein [Yersinia enterocolitica]|uniref:hypothetical protein n=1 Tax=Yersinia enterocolitica TaxID=630 RepID=UPI003D79A6D8
MSNNQTQDMINAGERMTLSIPLTDFDPYEVCLIYKDGSFSLIQFDNAKSITQEQIDEINKFNPLAVNKIEEKIGCKLRGWYEKKINKSSTITHIR